MINDLVNEAHRMAVIKGFHDHPKTIGCIIALIHSEASEALESDRNGRYSTLHYSALQTALKYSDKIFIQAFEHNVKDTFEDELADIVIRVMDLAGLKEIDLETHILAKMRYNATRPSKHGKK